MGILPIKYSGEKAVWILASLGILLMFGGFLFSRVLSNIGFLFVGVAAIVRFREAAWLFRDKWMITFVLLAMVPLVSDIWYEGSQFYAHRGIMKTLLILFPVFVFGCKADSKYIRFVHFAFMTTMGVASAYSSYHYAIDFDTINEAYKTSKVMKVLSFSDHIRISWAIVISVVMALYEYKLATSSKVKWGLVMYIVFQVLFIHLLGSKTGLLMLYMSAVIYFIYTLPSQKKWLWFLILPVLVLTPYLAYKTVPSLQQRVNFIIYDFEHYSKGDYKDGLSDAVRFYSLQAGQHIIHKHPYIGVGFSNLQSETEIWYRQYLPQLSPDSYFLPSSQVVIYWASGGLIGLMVMLAHIFLPFFKPDLRHSVWFMMFFVPAVCSFAFETHLEGQLPLFVYGFFVSWFWYLAICNKDIKFVKNKVVD